ncbi:TD and POZ domain-containing protein 4 [Araneus ventricosus]|uniref:TD and POZ domain-containing protein 4 n=1 Tax=Araneus ventricosus TaxID=182803 RepID=A0A4Y2G9R2_ARAVE|nr:TD and POZ domain-containing protein 4 [Araneus ventricosus]
MERMEYTITWFIENYSYCLHKNTEELISPQFFANGLESSAWLLYLYPRGSRVLSKGCISLFLKRSEFDDGPGNISLKYELSFLGADGSAVTSKEMRYTFKKGDSYGYFEFLQMNDSLLRGKADLLPQDTLSVRCKMWMNEGDIHKVGKCSARTRIVIRHISFLHIVEGFSILEPNQKKTFEIQSSTKEECVTSSMYLTDSSCCDERIILEITPSSTKHILSKCKCYLLDTSGNVMKCGEEDNRSDATRKDISKLPLSLTRKSILNRKSEYLPDDKLTLLCECTFSTGNKYEKIERILHEIPSVVLNKITNDNQNNDKYNVAGKLSACSSILDDLKALYKTQLLTDVELKTKTKSFRAHKNLLCARSPVFKAMLTNDMQEKNTDCIQVDDLENDTVEKLLNFVYSDNLENLQWDSAIKLYYVADKYAVEKLKLMCSSMLLDNLSTSTAIELLLLADTHNDSDLQKAVGDFILKHEEQVFGSDEWVNLIEINPVLVSKTMLLKYMRSNKILEK